MRTKLILAVLGLVLVVGGFTALSFLSKAKLKEDMGNTLVRMMYSAGGAGSSSNTLFTDKTFLDKNNSFGENSCVQGVISDEDYTAFVSYLRATDFLKKKIDQRDDSNSACEGGARLTVALDGNINDISTPCVGEYTSQTKEILKLMEEIGSHLGELIQKSKGSPCSPA